MKKLITKVDDVVSIIKHKPILLGKEEVNKSVKRIYDYAYSTKYPEATLLSMCLSYGYALGKHDERAKRKGVSVRTTYTQND